MGFLAVCLRACLSTDQAQIKHYLACEWRFITCDIPFSENVLSEQDLFGKCPTGAIYIAVIDLLFIEFLCILSLTIQDLVLIMIVQFTFGILSFLLGLSKKRTKALNIHRNKSDVSFYI